MIAEIIAPAHQLACDAVGCTATYRADPGGFSDRIGGRPLRAEARRAGWSTRPPSGRGSRTGADHCPDHKPEASAR